MSSLLSASTTVKSAISGCNFTSAFIVVNPSTRQGFASPALEKHRRHRRPVFAYFAVSTMDGWIICNHGVFGSPCGAIRRCAICRSNSAWSKNFDCGIAAVRLGAAPGDAPPAVRVLVQPADARVTATAAVSAVARLDMDTPFPRGLS